MIIIQLYLVLIFVIIIMINIYYRYNLEYKQTKINNEKKNKLFIKTLPCFLNKCDKSYRFCRSNDQKS